MQPRQEFLVYEPKLLVEGALLENLFNQKFLLLNKKFMVRNSVGAACVRLEGVLWGPQPAWRKEKIVSAFVVVLCVVHARHWLRAAHT
jgi:hypothetical protein